MLLLNRLLITHIDIFSLGNAHYNLKTKQITVPVKYSLK